MLHGMPGPSRRIDKIERKDDMLFMHSAHSIHRIARVGSAVRVTSTVKDCFEDWSGKPGVVNNLPSSDWSFEEDELSVVFKTADVTVRIDRETSAFTFLDLNGAVLFSERSKDPKTFTEFETYKLSSVGSVTEKVQTPDGEKIIIREAGKEPVGRSYRVMWYPEWGDEDLYGLGQHEEGYSSLRGRTVYVHQANRKIAIPMLVSTKCYGILTECYSPMIFNDSVPEPYILCESVQELDYYFIKADTMNGVIAGYRELTGKASMLPKWAFGYVQSKERYETAEQVISTEKEAHRRGFGLDCMVVDWLSWPDGQWGQKTFDRNRFPDPKAMMDELHKDNVHFMISVWPTASTGCPNRISFDEKGLILPASEVYNAILEEGREEYFRQLSEDLLPAGTDAWWCDSSEPITPEWSFREKPEPSRMYADFFREMSLRIPSDLSNSYPLFHAQGIYDGWRKAYKNGEKRVCNLTRSAYTGQQRYGTIMWSGDIAASWKTLKEQIGAGLGFCASGLPYWTIDIGAFFISDGSFWYWKGDYPESFKDDGYRELYTRWYQYGAFLPIFRAHGTDCDREPWVFGDEGDMFYEAMKEANHLRYRLLPYIYSEAGKVWHDDASLMLPLVFSFPEDKKVRNITDQYMFGEALMVCPVTAPMYFDKGSRKLNGSTYKRKVYLPEGCDWYDFYTHKAYKGGTTVEADAPIDRIPLFVRNGSIIPTCKEALTTADMDSRLTFLVFSDHDCSYCFYNDAGDGYDYETGSYELKDVLFKDGQIIM